jgi:hypothetical protein
MPGEFYIEGKKEKVDLTEIKNIANQLQNVLTEVQNVITEIQNTVTEVQNNVTQIQNNTTNLVEKSEGIPPVTGSTTADWQTAELDVVTLGASGTRYKVHSLLLSVHNLVGVITVRLYMAVNSTERKVYEQSFNAPGIPGLWIINGTLAIHEALRVTLQSDNAADNGQAVDYDYMLEAME